MYVYNALKPGWDQVRQIPVRVFHLVPYSDEKYQGRKELKDDVAEYRYLTPQKILMRWNIPGSSKGELTFTPRVVEEDHAICDPTFGPLGQYWQVSSRWPHTNCNGHITSMDGDLVVNAATGYNENAGGFTFLANFGWFFFVHTSQDVCFSLQTYCRTRRLSELLLFIEGKKHTFKELKFERVESKVIPLLYGEQYVPTGFRFSCEDDDVTCKFHVTVSGHVESDKNHELLWQRFFILFCVGKLSGSVHRRSDGSLLRQIDGDCGGEYAHHSLWLDKVAVES